MKLGILGTGMIVKDLMQIYDELPIEKTYLLGVEQAKAEAEEMAKTHHMAGVFYDYDELLASEVDTIYVALPNALHYSFALKALEHNKNIILEKPITANAQELKDLMALADRQDLILLEAMSVPYMPAFQGLKAHLKDLGDIKIVSFNYSQYSSRYDAFKQGTILPAFDYHKAGGALYDLNVYNVHALLHLFGKPDSVYYEANIEKGIDTSGILILDYGTFKAVSIGAKDCKAPLMNTIQGDQGCLVMDTSVNNMRHYTFMKNNGETEHEDFDEKTHRMFYEFEAFIRIIDGHDRQASKEALVYSLMASELMEKARKEKGVQFDNDK